MTRERATLLAAAIGAGFLVHAFYLAGFAEDAFISLRFARNLVEGHGLVWTPGEPPVQGYTNFLWVLLSALWILVGVDPIRGTQLLGVAASLATLAVTWRSGRLAGWSPTEALLPCLLLALSGPFAAWATGGLETNAYGALLVLGAFHFARAAREERARDPWLCFGFLLLAMLTRPEGVVAACVVLVLGWLLLADRPPRRRGLLLAGLSCLALYALYLAWCWAYFGDPLPNTFHAKTGGGLAQFARGGRYALWFAAHYVLPWLPLLLFAALAGPGASALRSGPGASAARRNPVLLTAAALLLADVGVVVWEGGDYMAMYRFFVPALPFLDLLLGAAALRVLRGAAPPSRRAAGGALLACGALGTLLHSTPLEARLLPAVSGMHGNWRGVQTERWHVARLSTIGRFFADEARPGESLATDAIGAIGWYSRLPVYGAHGLVDPDLAQRRDARVGRGVAGHDRLDFAYLFSKRPTFLMFRRDLRPQPLRRLDLNVAVDESIAAEYELRSVWLEDPRNGEAGWFSFLERRDRAAPPPAEAGSAGVPPGAAGANGVWPDAPRSASRRQSQAVRSRRGPPPPSERR